jgi:carbamoyl-phosphate synthase large subunit
MVEIGLQVPKSGFAHSSDEAMAIATEIGFPVMVRPSFILGGLGTGIAHDGPSFDRLAREGLAASPVGEILVERSVAGWKEYELEVMRDGADNCVVVCSIENLDPMGVHTGDSITVAPAQTLTDVEYQAMRDDAFACLRRVGVETGGSNVQFAVDPATGHRLIIEMNPRVSRSSALASKATGFPIAKIAARLAVGYRLDEITNDITGATPASFEPTIDYVVTKIPRWAFEKLPGSRATLGTRMQSVGEVMALGRTFCESLQKAIRSLEQGRAGLNADPAEVEVDALDVSEVMARAEVPAPDRLFAVESALRRGVDPQVLAFRTGIDPWFLVQIRRISDERLAVETVARSAGSGPEALTALGRAGLRRAKRLGFADEQLAYLLGVSEHDVRTARSGQQVRVTYKTVDTCGAEFEAHTPYHYGTYEDEEEVRPSKGARVVILGSGPNRIGQGIEFDYCCVHASMALRAAGFETVMVNCNPETVSTDYDISDRLYFEPLSPEDVANVVESEQRASEAGGRVAGVVVALGGQTPLKLAASLPAELVLGTSPSSIDLAEDREQWNALCARLGIAQPPGGTATTVAEALTVAERIGYPVLLRPSYVLGGRAMEIVYDAEGVRRVMAGLTGVDPTGVLGGSAASGISILAREGGVTVSRPVLVDRFLEDAIEVDVDAVRDCQGEVLIGGVMEHVEQAGVHSGDSACALPPQTLAPKVVEDLERQTRSLAHALEVQGLINVQFAVKDGATYVLEANPRASRTVPFVSKATGVPLAMVAARVMVGDTLESLRDEGMLPPGARGTIPTLGHVSVKEAVLPFDRFPEVDTLLGPEMRSTGEVMGVDETFGLAFAKSQLAAGTRLPASGTVFLSLADRDKPGGRDVARQLSALGFSLAATLGTAGYLRNEGIAVETLVAKVGEEGLGADAVQLIAEGKVQMVVNTPRGRGSRADGAHIRAAATAQRIPCLTTIAAARAAAAGIADQATHPLRVRSLQELHGSVAGPVVGDEPSQVAATRGHLDDRP